jgi:hypothetical protein
MSVAIVTQV